MRYEIWKVITVDLSQWWDVSIITVDFSGPYMRYEKLQTFYPIYEIYETLEVRFNTKWDMKSYYCRFISYIRYVKS